MFKFSVTATNVKIYVTALSSKNYSTAGITILTSTNFYKVYRQNISAIEICVVEDATS